MMKPSLGWQLLPCLVLLLSSIVGAEDFEYRGSGYRLLSTIGSQPLSTANIVCKTHNNLGDNPHVVTVDTAAENSYLKALLNHSTWIGITDELTEGSWFTESSTSQSFKDWAPGEPNGGATENCAHFHAGKAMRWSDADCGSKFEVLCEADLVIIDTTLNPTTVIPNGKPVIQWWINEGRTGDDKRELVLDCNTNSITDFSSYDGTPVIKWLWNNEFIANGQTLHESNWRDNEARRNNRGKYRKLYCEVHGTKQGFTVDKLRSNGFDFSENLIQVERDQAWFYVQEGDCIDVTLVQKIPFICADTEDCQLELLSMVKVNDLKCGAASLPQVNVYVEGNCNQIKLNGTGTASTELITGQKATIKICASFDGKADSWHNSLFTIAGRDIRSSGISDEWLQKISEFNVLVRDLNRTLTGISCYSNNDPHMKTFDGVRYEMHMVGVYTLYKHETLPVEVQVKFMRCNGQATCNCALAVIAWDSYFILDICDETNSVTRYYQDRKNLHVTESSENQYDINIKTGTLVKISSYWHRWFNIYVYPSYGDVKHVEGLCGNLNGNSSLDDEFYVPSLDAVDSTLRANTGFSGDHDFGKEYEVPESRDVINGCAREIVEINQAYPNWCVCNHQDERVEEEEVVCDEHEGAVPACYATNEFPGDKRINEPACKNTAKKRSIDRKLVKRTVTTTPVADWQNGWNEANAKKYCENAIFNASVSTLCDGVEGVNLNVSAENCYLDILFTGTTDFIDSTIDSIYWLCFHEVMQNVTVIDDISIIETLNSTINGSTSENITVVAPMTLNILEDFIAILCTPLCNKHGECLDGVCYCDHGYYGGSCEVEYSKSPTINSISGCNDASCTAVTLIGSGFTSVIDGVTCQVTITEMDKASQTLSTLDNVVNGTYLTSSMSACSVRQLSHFNMVEVKATNNNFNTTSNSVRFFVVPECFTCYSDESDSCSIDSGFCYINDGCHAENDRNGCLKCLPDTDQYQWTDTCPGSNDNTTTSSLTPASSPVLTEASTPVTEYHSNEGSNDNTTTSSFTPASSPVLTEASTPVTENHSNEGSNDNTTTSSLTPASSPVLTEASTPVTENHSNEDPSTDRPQTSSVSGTISEETTLILIIVGCLVGVVLIVVMFVLLFKFVIIKKSPLFNKSQSTIDVNDTYDTPTNVPVSAPPSSSIYPSLDGSLPRHHPQDNPGEPRRPYGRLPPQLK